MFDNFIKRCRDLGKDEPGLSNEVLTQRLAKIIVAEKVQDDDAFELAKVAYNKGQITEV